jgi:predicted DNA-binding WGR domain protein
MQKIYEWHNTSNQRYYIATLTQKPTGEFIIVKAWGGSKRDGGALITRYESEEAAIEKIKAINRRRQQHGYRLITLN